MKEKKIIYSEYTYFFGIIFLALSVSLLEGAGFGFSMVNAPAYLFYVKGAASLPWFSFGMAEYTIQAFILVGLFVVTGRFKKYHAFSFGTAVLYGFALDALLNVVHLIPTDSLYVRIALFVVALFSGTFGAALMRHTYISPPVYDFFVNEVADKFKKERKVVKLIFDLLFALIAVLLSFYFFGVNTFVGVNVGTIVIALTQGFLVNLWDKLIENNFKTRDKFKQLKRHFK